MSPEWIDVPNFEELNRWYSTHRTKSLTHDNLWLCDWYIDREICDYRYMNSAQAREDTWVGGWAESWEMTDPTHYVFHVRPGMVWHNKPPVNGREFVADDVVRTFERLLAGPVWAGHPIAMIEEITAPDKYTVKASTSEPFFNLLANMGEVNIEAHECWEEQGDMSHWTTCIGTGPFMLEDYVQGSRFSFIRNPDYWEKDLDGNPLPYLDGVEMFVMPEAATQLAALRTAKLDWDDKIMWQDKGALEEAAPELQWAANPDANLYLIWQKNSIEPFSNVKVRQAMRMAIDMQEIADTFWPPGVADIRNYPIEKSMAGMYTPFEELPEEVQKVLTHDPVAAKALLAETPWPNGFDTTIQYSIEGGQFEWSEDALVMIQDYWKDIGINLELETIDTATAAMFRSPPHAYTALFGAQGGGTIFPILNNYFKTGSIANRCVVSDPYIDGMVEKIAVEFDRDKRNAMFAEVFTYIEGQCIYIPLPTAVTYTAWWPWVKNYSGETTLDVQGPGHVFAHTWLDQDLREE